MGEWIQQVDAIKDRLMPQLLMNLDNLESFLVKSGVHIYDLRKQEGIIRPVPKVLNVIKEVAEKSVTKELVTEPQPSTSGGSLTKKIPKNTRRILDSDSDDDDGNVSTPMTNKKAVNFREPLTEVKGTVVFLLESVFQTPKFVAFKKAAVTKIQILCFSVFSRE